MTSARFIAPVLAMLLAGCGTTRSIETNLPEDVGLETRPLVFDTVHVSVGPLPESQLSAAVEGKGAATRDGLTMMAKAPVGCLDNMDPYSAGLCLGLAPLLPFLAAMNAEDPEVVHAALEDVLATFAKHDVHSMLHSRLLERLAEQRVPIAEGDADHMTENAIKLTVLIQSLQFEHSGYESGSITATLDYFVEVVDRDETVLARRGERLQKSLDGEDRERGLAKLLSSWTEKIVELSVDRMLVEWRPEIQLGYVYPAKRKKRSVIGIRYSEWVPVDSLTPTLEWQSLEALLPREKMAQISELSYEVDILAYTRDQSSRDWRLDTVQSARDLIEPKYKVSFGLLPCRQYYWSPRARFRYEGNTRTTSIIKKYVLNTPDTGCDSRKKSESSAESKKPIKDEP